MPKIHPVLLSGGSGARLWPLSRERLPKQFLPLVSDRTLFQQALLRACDSELFAPVRVIASAQHRFLVAQQMQDVGIAAGSIVLEPSVRNTAAAAAIAALMVAKSDPDGLLLLLPTDQQIVDLGLFHAALRHGVDAAMGGMLTLFGVTPDRPATGYGYIRVGDRLPFSEHARRGAGFVEKPDSATAEKYLARGDHFWNSGIFLMRVDFFLSELDRFEPDLLAHARAAFERASYDSDFVRLDPQSFSRCRAISLDHAVMERTDRLAVVPLACGWSDLGSWSMLAEIAERDGAGNVVIGNVLAERTRNSYLRSEGPLLATLGVEDLLVVATPDAVLVSRRDRDQDVARIVDRLRERDVDGP